MFWHTESCWLPLTIMKRNFPYMVSMGTPQSLLSAAVPWGAVSALSSPFPAERPLILTASANISSSAGRVPWHLPPHFSPNSVICSIIRCIFHLSSLSHVLLSSKSVFLIRSQAPGGRVHVSSVQVCIFCFYLSWLVALSVSSVLRWQLNGLPNSCSWMFTCGFTQPYWSAPPQN